jgi:rhamnosyltransferase
MNNSLYVIGSRGYRSDYGGWETFVTNLYDFWPKNRSTSLFIYGINQIKNYDHTINIKVNVKKINGFAMLVYASKAFFHFLQVVRKNNSSHKLTLLVLGDRIGYLIFAYSLFLKKHGVFTIVNPDGLEYKRSKFSIFEKIFLILSEFLSIKFSNHTISDSKEIKRIVDAKYKLPHSKSSFIPYGYEHLSIYDNEIYDPNILKQFSVNKNDYYLVVSRFVPENNLILIIKGFMVSKSKKKLLIISNKSENKYFKHILNVTNFTQDQRVIMYGPVYDKTKLYFLRKYAYSYIHGHSVGGTNPSLIESLYLTKINILYDVEFKKEVSQNNSLYFKNYVQLKEAIENVENFDSDFIQNLHVNNLKILETNYTWNKVITDYTMILSKNQR